MCGIMLFYKHRLIEKYNDLYKLKLFAFSGETKKMLHETKHLNYVMCYAYEIDAAVDEYIRANESTFRLDYRHDSLVSNRS